MAYSDLTLTEVRKRFQLTIDETHDLFAAVPSAALPARLRETLDENLPLAQGSNTEKARSELLIAPMLVELRRMVGHHIGLFSGVDFTVDEARGLSGFCDFIVTRSPELYAVTAPVLLLVEAKKENLAAGLGQCLGEMVAAREFNAREGSAVDTIYGAVTTGTNWKFLSLSGTEAAIDLLEYHVSAPGKVLGILQYMVGVT
ncbi:MAG: hypothetical protein HY909_12025 [Deltaproteobacteria bacterium]|nr:hypothetical protein [Deltaproteobacteria bacterium]